MMLDLYDTESVVGWIDGTSIGFRGFGNEIEAMHAAWVAYRTMARRVARQGGRRPIPIDTEPMALARSGDVERILAGGRPIATLVRPGAESRSGPESFGFALQLPDDADELAARSTAYLVYRTLRRSGIRWAMWAAAPSASRAPAEDASAVERGPAPAASTPTPSRRRAAVAAALGRRDDAPGVLGALAIILVMLAAVALPAITASTVVHLLGGAAALVAVVALASLVRLVVTDVRDAIRERGRRPLAPANVVRGTS